MRRGTLPEEYCARLKSLLRRDRVFVVEIDGFDQFVAEVHQAAKLELPRAISEPFDMARDRARLFVDIKQEELRAHPIIGGHIRDVVDGINTHMLKPPILMEAARLSSAGDLENAVEHWRRALAEEPDNLGIVYYYADTLARLGRLDDVAEVVLVSRLSADTKAYFLLRADKNDEAIELANLALESEADGSKVEFNSTILRINRAIALRRTGRMDEMYADLDHVEDSGAVKEAHIRAAVAALRDRKDEMLSALEETIDVKLSKSDVMTFPVFEHYRDDEDFLKLVREDDEEGGVTDGPD